MPTASVQAPLEPCSLVLSSSVSIVLVARASMLPSDLSEGSALESLILERLRVVISKLPATKSSVQQVKEASANLILPSSS